jgi:hypothetical protein
MKMKAFWLKREGDKRVEIPVVITGYLGNDDRFKAVCVKEDGTMGVIPRADLRVDVASLEQELLRPPMPSVVQVPTPSIGIGKTDGKTDQAPGAGTLSGTNPGEPIIDEDIDEEAAERVAAAKEYKAQQEKDKKLANRQAKT